MNANAPTTKHQTGIGSNMCSIPSVTIPYAHHLTRIRLHVAVYFWPRPGTSPSKAARCPQNRFPARQDKDCYMSSEIAKQPVSNEKRRFPKQLNETREAALLTTKIILLTKICS